MPTSNKFKSPLYFFVQTYLKFPGVKNIGKNNLQIAYDTIVFQIDNCCYATKKPTKSAFLKMFYSLLKSINIYTEKHKLEAVKKLLKPYIENNCCQ